MNPTLSVFAIAKNEENNIRSFIEHLQGFAEEIVIVVDASTTDNTLAVAQSLNAKAMGHPFISYSTQKQFALEQCTGTWVLNLDLDERLTEELKAEILATINNPRTTANLFHLPLRNIFLGKVMKHGNVGRARPPRLARRLVATFGREKVHERLSAPGKPITLKHYFLHNPYRDLNHFMAKMNDYTTSWAEDKFARGKKFRCWQLWRFPLDFFSNYILRGGFLEGRRGLIWSFGSTAYSFFKYAKLGQLSLRPKDVPTSSRK